MTETLPPEVVMPEVVMDDAQIDEAVRFINERVAAHVFNGSIEIGDYVLAKFYSNDIRLAGSRNGHKPVSYRKLCVHPDLSVSRTTLMHMVKTAAQEKFLIAGGILVDRLNYSQKVCLTRMENNEEKLALARACIDGKWITEELKRRVREICRQSTDQPVTVAVTVEKYLASAGRWLGRVHAPEGMTNYGYISSHLEPADKERILAAASGILENMTAATNAVRQLVTILTQPTPPPLVEGDILINT